MSNCLSLLIVIIGCCCHCWSSSSLVIVVVVGHHYHCSLSSLVVVIITVPLTVIVVVWVPCKAGGRCWSLLLGRNTSRSPPQAMACKAGCGVLGVGAGHVVIVSLSLPHHHTPHMYPMSRGGSWQQQEVWWWWWFLIVTVLECQLVFVDTVKVNNK